MLQVPQLPHVVSQSAEASALFDLLRPLLEDLARECEESPSFLPSASLVYTVPDGWLVLPANGGPAFLGAGWVRFPDNGYAMPALRFDGRDVECRGLLRRTSGTNRYAIRFATNSPWAPDALDMSVQATVANSQFARCTVSSTGVEQSTGSFDSELSLANLRWRPSGTPSDWRDAPRFTFTRGRNVAAMPELLLLQADTMDNFGRTQESRLCLPRWRVGQNGIIVTGCTELQPGQTYRLTAWAIVR